MDPAVLFDLEGTLVQTPWEDPQHVLEFRHQTRTKLIELGIPLSVLDGIERSTVMRNKASEYVEGNFSRARQRRYHQEMEKFLKQYELEAARRSKLFPETMSVLNELKKLGLRMGLITNTSREAVDIVFQLHALQKYFDVIVTRNDVKKLKPDSEGVLLAIKKLKASSFFMIGDLTFDMLAAKNANGVFIAVKRNPEDELDIPADFSVQSLSEVQSIVRSAARNQG
jgi:HAD superfamily hydrolase (TIGR01549 family)